MDAATMAKELDRLQAERDWAVRALDRRGRRARLWARILHATVGALILAFSLLLPITVVATVTHNVVLNTNGWVRTVGPIAHEPAVIDAVSRQTTTELYTAVNPEQVIADALPSQAAFLAGPIANAARSYVQDAITRVLQSPQFQTLWIQANRFAHAQLVSVLRGSNTTLQTTNGQVVLNLVPLLNVALQSLSGFISGVTGKPITLPAVSGDELPAAACAKISAALQRPLPATCGQIVLFPATKLTEARQAVRAFDRLVVVLLVVTPLTLIAGLAVSRQRRRTLPYFALGGLTGMVIARRVIFWLQHDLINLGQPANRAARQAILHHVLHGYFTVSYWTVVALLVVLAIALVTGPYAWARSLRHHLAALAIAIGHLAAAVTAHGTDDTATGWVRQHLNALRIAGVAVAALLILALPVSLVGLIIIAAVLALYEWTVHRISQTASAVTATSGPPSPQPPTTPPGPTLST
jgi:hypothetical protein